MTPLPPPQAQNTCLLVQQQQNQTMVRKTLSALHLPDAHIIGKFHIQGYPCHPVLECRQNDKNIKKRHHGTQSGQLSKLRNRGCGCFRQPGRAVTVEW